MTNVRKYLTVKDRREMRRAQDDKCFICGGPDPFIGEHYTPVAMGNDQKPDCLVCIPCAMKKTKQDVKNIAKVRRIQRQQEEGRSRPRRGRPFESGKKEWPKRKMQRVTIGQ